MVKQNLRIGKDLLTRHSHSMHNSVFRIPYSVFRIPYSVFRIPYSVFAETVFNNIELFFDGGMTVYADCRCSVFTRLCSGADDAIFTICKNRRLASKKKLQKSNIREETL